MMSATPSLSRSIFKPQPNTAFRNLNPLRSSPLASTRLIVKQKDNMARSYAGATTIPIVGYEHAPGVPSGRVLSRLNIFGLRRNVPDTCTEQEQGSVRGPQEAQRQEGKEGQKNDKRNATDDAFPPTNGEGGSGGWTAEGQSDRDGHGSEDAGTWTSKEALVFEHSGGSNRRYDGGGCASRWRW